MTAVRPHHSDHIAVLQPHHSDPLATLRSYGSTSTPMATLRSYDAWDVTTNINIDQYVKINASFIQNDQYIVDNNAIYEVQNVNIIKDQMLNQKILKRLIEQEIDIKIYTDGAIKNLSISDIKIGSAFLIDSPLNIEFNCRIEDNSSSNKTELVMIALSLMVCPKAVNAIIYTDSQWLWLFKMIRIYYFNVKLVKIKAYGNNENNKKVDKLAKLDRHQIECKVEELDMWDFNSLYNFTFLLKNQILIWKYRNELQVAKEKRCNISSKMKKMKLNNKKRKNNNVHVVNFNDETNWMI
ncbi:hypothetical protein RhiirC2_797833 [Rhizophagus irregularis]|uniref:RNase H type-1 domain-containing protein n=1 Tax=Rhizophagus irregularis TaxID=588596 RepID=A0A2N1M7C3_9GLOM|nr:hypothetical protein RhiirC2_797833 [Rhizophagus irregularis]